MISIHGSGIYNDWMQGHPVLGNDCAYIDTNSGRGGDRDKGKERFKLLLLFISWKIENFLTVKD